MGREEVLDRAKKHIFSTGVNDVASYLCRRNMRYGLAKFHLVQEKLGMEPNATFISAPDETITRNRTRWFNGVGYGGKISWGEGDERVIILDVMPNACGMLVGGIRDVPDPKEIIGSIHALKAKERTIDGIKIDWDFDRGNHFIDVYRIVRVADGISLPEYAFILHCSAPELKGDNPKGPGLYLHKSQSLMTMVKRVETLFGPCNVVVDTDASSYLKFYKYADRFAKKRRSLAAREIFGKYDEILNLTHQGLVNYNEICLGTHDVENKASRGIFPLALRSDLPAYLLRGNPSFDDETLETLGFLGRAERLGVTDRLRKANILPHGGGYTFPDMSNVEDVVETPTKRYFVVEMSHGMGHKIISDVVDLDFTYRGRSVILRALELGMGEIVARLLPVYVLKV